jgi:hypothetical protein
MELIAKVNKKLSIKDDDEKDEKKDKSDVKKKAEPCNDAVEETVKVAEEVVEKA